MREQWCDDSTAELIMVAVAAVVLFLLIAGTARWIAGSVAIIAAAAATARCIKNGRPDDPFPSRRNETASAPETDPEDDRRAIERAEYEGLADSNGNPYRNTPFAELIRAEGLAIWDIDPASEARRAGLAYSIILSWPNEGWEADQKRAVSLTLRFAEENGLEPIWAGPVFVASGALALFCGFKERPAKTETA